MLAAYSLAGLIFLVWLLWNTVSSHRQVKLLESNRLAVARQLC